MRNLDYLAAKYGQRIVDARNGFNLPDLENCVNSALSILHQQGLYAMFLWLHERRGHGGEIVGAQLSEMFSVREPDAPLRAQDLYARSPAQNSICLDNVRKDLTENLMKMFAAKELVSLALVYARHCAKTNDIP